jgi:phospholipase/lecithinase/hemolysin
MIPIISVRDQKAMFMDPAHPTAAGHQIIAGELVKTISTLPAYTTACTNPQSQLNSAKAESPAQTTTPVSSR